jgi:RNA polymerase sigma factor (sigma-70 family)
MNTTPPPEPPLTLEFLARTYAGYIEACLGRFGVGPADLTDLRQDVLCFAGAHLDQFEPMPGRPRDTSVRLWLYVISKNKASEHHRRRARERLPADPDARPEIASDAPAPDDLLIDLEDLKTFHALIDRLPCELRAVVIGHVCEGRAMSAVAAELNIPAGTAWTRFRQAMAELKAAYCRSEARERSRLAPMWLALIEELGREGERAASTVLRAAWKLATASSVAALLIASTMRVSIVQAEPPDLAARANDLAAALPASPSQLSAPDLPPKAPEPIPALEGSGTKVRPTSAPSALPREALPRREERAFLAKAQEELAAGRPDDALEALKMHRRKFPNSRLADLRQRLEEKVKAAPAAPRSRALPGAPSLLRSPATP